MGATDIPPAHVPQHVVPICNLLLQIGGLLWTICYILMWRSSIRTKSYGMPLFALALNLGWEVVYAFYVSESLLEKTVFGIWLLVDCGLIYGLVKFGPQEWKHAPLVAKNLGAILAILFLVAVAGNWSFAKWFLETEGVGTRKGKWYRGIEGKDTTELGFWSANLHQAFMGAASLSQLIVRQHSGGVGWGIWTTRFLGSLTGLYAVYSWGWLYWREGYDYVFSPFAIFLSVIGLSCDLVYPFVLYHVRKTERVLDDGRKVRGDAPDAVSAKKER